MKRMVHLSRVPVWIIALYAAATSTLPAQTFTTLYYFQYLEDGAYPYAGLVQATNGNLYGTNLGSALYDTAGVVYEINLAAPIGNEGLTLSVVYAFCVDFDGCVAGNLPYAGLVQARNGYLYGTTSIGGAINLQSGTIFKVAPNGTLTTMYTFCAQPNCTDGSVPNAGLVQAVNGDLYGTTELGGVSNDGTVFKMTPTGTLTTLYSFCASGGQCRDGGEPRVGLIQARNGDLYGTTYTTIFKITPSGSLTTLYNFCPPSGCTDFGNPSALVEATDGNFYGTTPNGGLYGQGSVFKMTPKGALTTIYSFCSLPSCLDGQEPEAALIQANDGNFYGTTAFGGSSPPSLPSNGDAGTIFKITPEGQLTTIYNICSTGNDCAGGQEPYAPLVQTPTEFSTAQLSLAGLAVLVPSSAFRRACHPLSNCRQLRERQGRLFRFSEHL